MNPQLAYRMAQFSQRDIHEASERARLARAASGPRWFRGFVWHRAGARSTEPQTTTQVQLPAPTARVAAGV